MKQAAPPASWPSPWGADDELGMLNHVTPAKRLQALELVREGRLYDLGRVLDEHVPVFPGRSFHQTLVTTAHHANMGGVGENRKSTRLNSSHITISYAVFCLKKKKN